MTNQTLPLDAIRIDGETQMRVQLDEDVVDEYARGYDTGARIPPIDVFYDGSEYWLSDGFHRYFGARRAGMEKIECLVREGSKADAQWAACAANATHGLRRTNADKRKATRAALLHHSCRGLSDSEVANHVGVSHPFVGRIRRQLESDGSLETVTSRKGKDGRTTNTADIGRKIKPSVENPACPNCHDPCETADTEPSRKQRPARIDADSPVMPLDDMDRDVPKHLHETFSHRSEFGRLARVALETAIEWRKLCESSAGYYSDPGDAALLEEFARLASAGRPALLCGDEPGWLPDGGDEPDVAKADEPELDGEQEDSLTRLCRTAKDMSREVEQLREVGYRLPGDMVDVLDQISIEFGKAEPPGDM